ncbi:MAG TPA: Rieske 2Fe-2S domain-containing protein [Candidatus Caenarcaniphilales bacterium]|nr:Rieske 2Fe-2S domain-containing protein [Candidatus Caenarcaniphilales bacterium]
MQPRLMPIPPGLRAPGTANRPYEAVAAFAAVPLGSMLRVTSGDLDLLIVHTEQGVCVTEDRCPHMAAPLSLGSLEGCVVACPLHRGRFDLATGDVVQFPTTGGLDADGGYHAPWAPADAPPRPEPPDLKSRARAQTRVRRIRYYPVRVRDGAIEVALPA